MDKQTLCNFTLGVVLCMQIDHKEKQVRKNKRKPVVSSEQKALLADLKRRFAECGHLVFRVSRYRRHHGYDFLAVPKDNPRQFLIVEPMHLGRVRVRPFGCDSLYVEAKRAVEEVRCTHKHKVHWYNQIPISRLKLRLEHYLTPTGAKELKRLTGFEV